MRVKLKRLKRKKRRPRAQLSKLKEESIRSLYSVTVRNKYEGLEVEEAETAEQQWGRLSEALVEAAHEVVPKQERTMRREWMTEEILRKMEARRRHKRNTPEYRRLDSEIRRECNQAKERWLNEKCDKNRGTFHY